MGRKNAVDRSRQRRDPKRNQAKSGNRWLWPVVIVVILAVAGGLWWARGRRNLRGVSSVIDVVKLETSKGNIVLEVYSQKVPVTAKNFVDLVKSGFYDGLIWHRVEDWVVQTGDPTGTGMGGSKKTIKLEINRDLSNTRGAVGMARSSHPDSASSQFYIVKSDAVGLDGRYAVFARVTEGMDVVGKLAIGDKLIKATLETPAGAE